MWLTCNISRERNGSIRRYSKEGKSLSTFVHLSTVVHTVHRWTKWTERVRPMPMIRADGSLFQRQCRCQGRYRKRHLLVLSTPHLFHQGREHRSLLSILESTDDIAIDVFLLVEIKLVLLCEGHKFFNLTVSLLHRC